MQCYKCKKEFKPRKAGRQRCPKCFSPYWRIPTFTQRIRVAWEAFKLGHGKEVKNDTQQS